MIKVYVPISTAIVLSILAGIAHAGVQTMGSPAIYLSTDQHSAECTVRNIGTKDIAVQVGIFGEAGNAEPLTTDTCNGAPLAAGKACRVTDYTIANGVAYACSVTASKVKYLRGALFLKENTSFPGRSVPLR
jgi:hypothetical protein